MPFIVFEIDAVKRAVNAEEALAVRSALAEHAEKVDSALARQLAIRIDVQIWDPGEGIRLSPEERRELLAAMESAGLGHKAHAPLEPPQRHLDGRVDRRRGVGGD